MLDAPARPTPPGAASATGRTGRGRYAVRYAVTAEDLDAAQRLRGLAFAGPGRPPDKDRFDALCRHLLVEDPRGGALVATCRVRVLSGAAGLDDSYAAQTYDLAALARFPRPMAEIGRFCIRPGLARDADILRLTWAALAGLVDAEGIGLLFGCASFPGTDPAVYRDAFGLLAARHRAPAAWRPGRRAAQTVPLTVAEGWCAQAALRQMPPLLRSYLGLGGWVGDHAVIDRRMNTLHVFTAVEVAAIPPGRARALRALAAS
ncbi:MAG: ornithine-acyl[acyl carrier protein] N-acyltransferase [Rhodobacteraceae bacterium HLUCCA08]|nr:MAG: ornithine-acyl[acyl carrier protein] N-acyltransferase [Rhodobacteraceae bacterium HLUCCA08]